MRSTAPSTILGGGATGGGVAGDPCLSFRQVHPRLSSSPQPPFHYLYTAAPSTLQPAMSYPSTYPGPPPRQQPAVGDYVIGHAVTAGDALMQPPPPHHGSSFCFGAPLTTAPPPAVATTAAAAANVQAADKALQLQLRLRRSQQK